MSSFVFLSAEWKHLILFNYKVPEKVLIPHLPPECELDYFDGSPFVSLVGFQFLRTRVLGIKWPFYTNFSEINLRFYIRHKGERGVCFIREYVPKILITAIARGLYNEPYKTAAMQDTVSYSPKHVRAEYTLQDGNSNLQMFAEGKNWPTMPTEDSMEHFFKEHELGVGQDKNGNLLKYTVWHPHWNIFPVTNAKTSLDWELLYGKPFSFLAREDPYSVCFAEGSEIKVYFKD